MENGWIKRFKDGEIVVGPDCEEATSWSRSRLEGMSGCELLFNGSCATIEGEGEYHQSDDFVVFLGAAGQEKPEKIYRRLQLKLGKKWLTVLMDPQGGFVVTIENGKI